MSSEGQVPLSLLGHLPIPRTNDTGRRGSLGSGIIGGLLQFASPKFASPMSSLVNGFSAEYESIPDIHRTGNESAAKIHKLRDQVRSRSEPCLCYMTTRRSKALSHSGSRCLSPLTPRRLASQTSPRVQPATERLRHRESRRWSCHSIPSIPSDRGYLTQDLILIIFLLYTINPFPDNLKSHAIPL
ncbi:unnamed protein product [Oikopleura dioica]|uniref:Uncharacterized protein n=1 Tax=Oikopleura dioica TaxID=34765 RepID=E4XMQ1_OIKDI|nr:unnamed protein product [Oikopleura dioica]